MNTLFNNKYNYELSDKEIKNIIDTIATAVNTGNVDPDKTDSDSIIFEFDDYTFVEIEKTTKSHLYRFCDEVFLSPALYGYLKDKFVPLANIAREKIKAEKESESEKKPMKVISP